MKSIVVFCGSAAGNKPVYTQTAKETGILLANKGVHIVYGGARIGIMGAVADAALTAGGTVTGVIPHFLQTKEVAHTGLTDLITVNNMHERKLKMHEMSEGIIALPGGWGTMEELFEMLTWAQLGLHGKPIGVLNVNGFYDALIALCDKMVSDGFLAATTRQLLLVSDNITDLLLQMEQFIPHPTPKWMTEDRT